MEMRPLGRSDLKVSAAALGVMTFGSQTDEAEAFAQLDLAFERGINFFDTAENYPSPVLAETHGRSEQILGRWIKARGVRDRVVVATKITGPGNAVGDMSHIRGADRRLDRANILAAVETSLKRLGVDYIDHYQLHWPDRPITTSRRQRYSYIPDAPEIVLLEDTLGALGEVVAAGKVRHIGVANETPWGVMRCLALSEQGGLPRIATIQNGYSLVDRSFELELAEVAMREQVGLMAFSPLAGGILTGKYLGADSPPPDSRAADNAGFAQRLKNTRMQAAAQAYVDIARRHGLDPADMALAFVRQRPFMTSVLVAARTVDQLARNLKGVELSLSREVVREIDAVHDAAPNPAR